MENQYLKSGAILQNGKYRILEVLGQGGFGITYKALMIDMVSGRLGTMEIEVPVAIKEFFMKDNCVRDDDSSHVSIPSVGMRNSIEQFRNKFVKEANNLSNLSHPNIVKVIDVFSENGTDYYVMEYLEGGSFKDLVKNNGSFDEATALEYIYKVGDALSYMHTQKHMCHYDVKPGNIMLDKQNNPKLIDFGISKNYDSEGNQTSSTPVGISKGFAPLEQYQQSVSEFSPQTDVYALGATLYYLLTGNVPPEASLVFNEGLPAMPDTISPSTRDAINQAMEPRKKDRPKTIKAFISLLKGEDDSSQVENDYTYVHAGENYYDVNEEEVDNNTSDETLVEYMPPTQIQQDDKITLNNTPKDEEPIHSSIKASFFVLAGLGVIILLSILLKHSYDYYNEVFGYNVNLRNDSTTIIYPYYTVPDSTAHLGITQIILSPEQTKIDFYTISYGYAWFSINKNAYLKYNDKKYYLKDAIGIEKAPNVTMFNGERDVRSFSLIFPPLPSDAGTIDFIEDEESNWKIHNIYIDSDSYKERDNVVKEIISNMVEVKGGDFMMGDNGWVATSPKFNVELSDYYICKYEVTQREWELITSAYRPISTYRSNKPVTSIDYYDCLGFVARLSRLSGRSFRLPTEAEWEYAARGGKDRKDYKFSGSNILDVVAWYAGNSNNELHAVGQKEPNALGLYDMSGNVFEWCEDWYGSYDNKSKKNPTGPSNGDSKVTRGGSYYSKEKYNTEGYSMLWVYSRTETDPMGRYSDTGFRIVMEK